MLRGFASLILTITNLIILTNAVSIRPINNTQIVKEIVGKNFLYHKEIKITIAFKITELTQNAQQIHSLALAVHNYCQDYNCDLFGYDIIKNKLARMDQSITKLDTILHKRNRRGILNIIGSASKALFGTLDEDDLTLVNQNIDKLFSDQNQLTKIVQNQTIMFKALLTDNNFHSLTNKLQKNSKELHELQNALLLEQNIIILEALSTDLTSRINDFYLTLILGKRGIIDTTLIQSEDFLEAYDTILRDNFMMHYIPATPKNFQTLIDISRLKTQTVDNALIYQIIVPVLEESEWSIIKYYAIPHKINNVFFSPILDHDMIMQQQTFQIIIDESYLEKYCRDSSIGLICERTQPTRHDYYTGCQNSKDYKQCGTAIFRIDDVTFIPMHTPNKYIAIPKEPIEIQTLCTKMDHITLNTPAILTSEDECILMYNNNIMKIGGTTQNTQMIISDYAMHINFTESDMQMLKEYIPQAPRVTPNFNSYRQTLDSMNSQLNDIKIQRRILTTAEIAYNIFKIAGWISLGLIIFYVLYKTGLFNLLSKLIPKTFCLKICCNEVNVNNRGGVQNTHSDPTATAPSTSTNENPLMYPLDELPRIPSRPKKIVRFGGPKLI
ncbi:uncharacterized protein LOC143347671 [Colletes latitarsis]|uniref:uncharacterized protein LOC143347671 n=1 Tax=Colletes latitarsis TaxID=2605962 RepID=UPI004036929C